METIKLDESRKEKLVFFADDSSTVRKLVSRLLEQSGFNNKGFDDGASLIEFLQECSSDAQPDVIVLDVEMTIVDGFED